MQTQGKEGEVLLAFTVRKTGLVDNLRVAESSDVPELDAAAIICASHWLYKPATQDGQPVDIPWKAKVLWKLPSPESKEVPPAPAP